MHAALKVRVTARLPLAILLVLVSVARDGQCVAPRSAARRASSPRRASSGELRLIGSDFAGDFAAGDFASPTSPHLATVKTLAL